MPEPAQQPVRGALHRRPADDRRDRDHRGAARSQRLADRPAPRGSDRSRRPGCSDTARSRWPHAGSRARPGPASNARAAERSTPTTSSGAPSRTRYSSKWTASPPRRDTSVGHGSSDIGRRRGRHAEEAAQLVGDGREPGALAQAQGAVQADGVVAVAEAEPGVVAEAREGLDQLEAIAGQAPAPRRLDASRERVGDDVEVRGDVDAVERRVVAGVHDRCHLAGRDRAREAAQEARGSDPARRGRPPAPGAGPATASPRLRVRRAACAARAGRSSSACSPGRRRAISRSCAESASGASPSATGAEISASSAAWSAAIAAASCCSRAASPAAAAGRGSGAGSASPRGVALAAGVEAEAGVGAATGTGAASGAVAAGGTTADDAGAWPGGASGRWGAFAGGMPGSRRSRVPRWEDGTRSGSGV